VINEFIKTQSDKKFASQKAKQTKDEVLKFLKNSTSKVSLSNDLIEILTFSDEISKIAQKFSMELNY